MGQRELTGRNIEEVSDHSRYTTGHKGASDHPQQVSFSQRRIRPDSLSSYEIDP